MGVIVMNGEEAINVLLPLLPKINTLVIIMVAIIGFNVLITTMDLSTAHTAPPQVI